MEIDHDDAIPGKRPYLDQISLPVAGAIAGTPVEALNPGLNFSLFRVRGPNPESARLLHYHNATLIRGHHSLGLAMEALCRNLRLRDRERIPAHFAKFLGTQAG